MASRTMAWALLSSSLLLACGDRETLGGSTEDGGDDEGSTDTGTEDPDPSATSTGGPGSDSGSGTHDDGSSDGGDPTEGDGPGPEACEGNMPTCFEDLPGTCTHIVEEAPAACDGVEWICPEGFAREGDLMCTPEELLCQPGDRPPSDCYDQGPGECGDFAPPPNCTDGVWTCPNGYDFGGFGDGCTFPD